jgi:hypothetical protein
VAGNLALATDVVRITEAAERSLAADGRPTPTEPSVVVDAAARG